MKVRDYHDALSNSLLFVSILLLFKLIEHHSNHINSPPRDAKLCLLLISLMLHYI